MSNRIKIDQIDPVAYKAMIALESYLQGADLNPMHKHLIKIRASQINGCAFCINMHTIEARKAGETEQRIYALSAWRDTPFFDEQEQAILALTEEVTLISNHVSDQTYRNAAQLFSEKQLAAIIMAIITINGWNRLAISTKLEPALA